MLKVYLDVCALNRLSDDQSQARIRREAQSIEAVFRMIFLGEVT